MPSPTGWSEVRGMPAASEPLVRALLDQQRWASTRVSYSFPEPGSVFSTAPGSGYGGSDGEPGSPYFAGLTASNRQGFAAALAAWAEVADLQFVPVADNGGEVGDIRAAYSWLPAFDDFEAWAYTPAPDAIAGDIWFNARAGVAESHWSPGTGAYATVLHEIGHALGLKHPFEGPERLPPAWDTQSYTVMSYAAVAGNAASSFDVQPTTPMLLDIRAIQHAYGANSRHEAGDSVYVFGDQAAVHETLWDAGGRDLVRYDGGLPVEIDLRAGHGSLVGPRVHALDAQGSHEVRNLWVAWDVTLEDAIGGGGDDGLTGNDTDNVLQGATGNDRLLGGAGADLLNGGPGDDQLDGGDGLDLAVFGGTLASYAVARSGAGATVRGPDGSDALTGVERLRFGHDELALDLEGHAGQAYRLYRAALDRAPDTAGLGYQVRTLDSGVSLLQVAGNFMASPEFQLKYGALDDAAFVNGLYRNVLEREPESAGLAYHLQRLGGGASRAEVLVGFSESPENHAAVIGSIANGIHYTV